MSAQDNVDYYCRITIINSQKRAREDPKVLSRPCPHEHHGTRYPRRPRVPGFLLLCCPLQWSKSLAKPRTFFPRVEKYRATHTTPTSYQVAYLIAPRCYRDQRVHSIQVERLRRVFPSLLRTGTTSNSPTGVWCGPHSTSASLVVTRQPRAHIYHNAYILLCIHTKKRVSLWGSR